MMNEPCFLCEEDIDNLGGVLLGSPLCEYCAGVVWRCVTSEKVPEVTDECHKEQAREEQVSRMRAW